MVEDFRGGENAKKETVVKEIQVANGEKRNAVEIVKKGSI
jgi:hypothetical protein